MRTARDVLNELRWRKGRNLKRAEIWIADRISPGGVRVLSGAEITELGHRYFSTARATIPFYKIVKITCVGEVLFERVETLRARERVDRGRAQKDPIEPSSPRRRG